MNDFIKTALEAARRARSDGAPINPKVAAAQAHLESAGGESQLALKANNLFGIKAGSSWDGPTVTMPTKEEVDGEMVDAVAEWRAYENWRECFKDYGALIERLGWYQDAEDAADHPIKFLLGLSAWNEPGWATDSRYVEKVLRVMMDAGLLEDDGGLDVDRFEVCLGGACIPIPFRAVSVVESDRFRKLFVRLF